MATGADPLQTAIALHKAGNLAQAEQIYNQILASNPRHPDALHLLGLIAQRRGRHDAAIASIRQAIAIQPNVAAYHSNLGEGHRALAQLDEARACYEQALRLKPDLVEARRGLAYTFWAAGDVDAAAACFMAAMQQDANHLRTLLDYGRLLESLGRGPEALEMSERALRFNPGLAAAHFNHGRALLLMARKSAAAAAIGEALRRDPSYVEAYVQLASLYNLRPDPDSAVEICKRGLQIDPKNAALYNTMGYALREQGRGAEAVDCFREIVALRPDNAMVHSSLLYTLNFMDGYEPQQLYEEHLTWARRHAEPLTAIAPPHANDRAPERRLKVGYVSPFFCESAVNYFVEPILQAHDHDRFEVTCYASFAAAFQPDAVTSRLQTFADHWRDVRAHSDEQLAALVRSENIDILVDLSGHMSQSRLLTFARRAAPVQVTYIGYQNTTGMTAMDYRLTDARANPQGTTDAYYTEQLERLPRCFFCYKPSVAPKVSPLPARDSGRVTFGSFNHLSKISPRVLDTWLELLTRVPNSRLLMVAYRGGHAERHVTELATKKGIERERIEFHGRCPRPDYLQLVQQADIALDPFPFNGHTTTCDAIWMGVPVVMLEGQTYVSRVGACVLEAVGLDHFVAGSVDAYLEIAVRAANDLEGLAQLRRQLRARMSRSPILDFAGFTRNLEAAYRRMWADWCTSRESLR